MLRSPRGLTLLLAVLVAAVAVAAVGAADCPQHCECKWKGGKESAICRSASLKQLPKGLDAGTQLLDLTGNSIASLGKEAFASAGLVNLQKVYLPRCRLASIDRLAFRLLINLVELDLSYNELQAVPSHALDSTAELRELRLSGNPIARIDSNAFFKVPQLVRLEMSDCKLSAIEVRAFAGLEKSLEWLKLDHNRLSTVLPEAFSGLSSLHGLELDGNPWNCTCALRPFRLWMVLQRVPSSVPAVCAAPPRLRGRPWDRLDADEFACGPRVQALRGEARAEEGGNVTLSCRVQGAPSPNVRWLFRNRVVANLSAPLARRLLFVRTAGNSSNLTIVALDPQDAGVYSCVADNRAGKVDASVTLSVSRRTAAADAVPLSGKVVAASVLVAALFALSTCLVALCLWSLRKRHSLWVEQARRCSALRRCDDNNHYEKIEMMNHKPAPLQQEQPRAATTSISSNSAVGNHTGALSREHPAVQGQGPGRPARVPGRPPGRLAPSPDGELVPPVALRRGGGGHGRKGRYRGVPTRDHDDDPDEMGYDAEVEMTPTASNAGGPWASAREHRSSDDTLSSNHSDTRSVDADEGPGPGPRRGAPLPEAPLANGLAQGAQGLAAAVEARAMAALSHHVLRKQVLSDSGGSLYTSLLDDPCDDHDRSYPDLLQPQAPQADPLLPGLGLGGGSLGLGGDALRGGVSGLWGTMPRRPHHRGDRPSRRGSESPLLTDSRYGSSGGSSSSGLGGLGIGYPLPALAPLPHQRSSSSLNLVGSSPLAPLATQLAGRSGPGRRNPSLPGSPSRDRTSETPILAALNAKRGLQGVVSPSSYDYHTAQLERFLEEYRTLHSELSKMKETCDSLSSNPKSILKKKAPSSTSSSSSGHQAAGHQPPALSPEHPYWVPRSGLAGLARRYSGGDFYPS